MSAVLMKYLFKRNVPDLHFGTDPYFEPDDTRRKKFKEPPAGISPHDAKILKKVRRKAYRLDQSISCCCCSFRVGWSAIIGIVPFVGDAIDAFLTMRIIELSKTVEGGLPESVVAQMYANLVVDFGVGLIPFVGDIADMIYKCNTRNLQILEKHLVKKTASGTQGQIPQGGGVGGSANADVPHTQHQAGHQQISGVHGTTAQRI